MKWKKLPLFSSEMTVLDLLRLNHPLVSAANGLIKKTKAKTVSSNIIQCLRSTESKYSQNARPLINILKHKSLCRGRERSLRSIRNSPNEISD